MKFKLEFDCDNAAFADDPRAEIARILEDVANKIDAGSDSGGPVRDLNGNRVGLWQIEGEA